MGCGASGAQGQPKQPAAANYDGPEGGDRDAVINSRCRQQEQMEADFSVDGAEGGQGGSLKTEKGGQKVEQVRHGEPASEPNRKEGDTGSSSSEGEERNHGEGGQEYDVSLMGQICGMLDMEDGDESSDDNSGSGSCCKGRELPSHGQAGDPLLGLSVKFLLSDFMEDVRQAGFDTDSTVVYDIEERVIRAKGAGRSCPRDGLQGCAYVDAVEGERMTGRATHMLSYTWAYRLRDIVDSLGSFCQSQSLSPSDTYIWICCLCINQHRVKEAQARNEHIPFHRFAAEFGSRVENIGNVLALMTPWKAPKYVSRVWCIFELSTALQLQDSGCQLDIIMPPSQAVEFAQAIFDGPGMEQLWESLKAIRVEKAQASVEQDKVNILEMIEANGGYAKHNAAVVKRLQMWLSESAESQVMQKLQIERGCDTAEACFQVAKMFRQLGCFDQSGTLMSAGQQLLEEMPGGIAAAGSAAVSLFRGTGILHWQRGQLADAARSLKEARDAQERLGTLMTSADGANLLRHIGTVQRLQDSSEAALATFSLALDVYTASQTLRTSDCASLFQEIGTVHAHAGRSELALENFIKAENTHRAAMTFETPDCAGLLQNMGIIRMEQGDLDSASLNFEEAKSVFEATGTLATPNGANLLFNMAILTMKQGELSFAAVVFHDSLSLFEQCSSLGSPNGLNMLEQFGDCQRELEDYEGAHSSYLKGLSLSYSVADGQLRLARLAQKLELLESLRQGNKGKNHGKAGRMPASYAQAGGGRGVQPSYASAFRQKYQKM